MTENVLTEDKYGKSALLPMAIKIPFFFFFFFENFSPKFSVCPLRMNRLKACMVMNWLIHLVI